MNKRENIYIHDPRKNKKVMAGWVEGDTFFKIVKSNHFYIKGKGYCIQEDCFAELVDKQVKHVFILTETGKEYYSKLEQWSKRIDEGHGVQRLLAVKEMQEIN